MVPAAIQAASGRGQLSAAHQRLRAAVGARVKGRRTAPGTAVAAPTGELREPCLSHLQLTGTAQSFRAQRGGGIAGLQDCVV